MFFLPFILLPNLKINISNFILKKKINNNLLKVKLIVIILIILY